MDYRTEKHQLPFFPADFEFLWPDCDESLAGDLPTLKDIDDHVMPHVPQTRRRTCVQAGGAIGAWPKRFAQLFDTVYTFEPYPPSFHCLCVNVPELNVIKLNAALGDRHGLVRMDFPEHRSNSRNGKENIGGYRVFPEGVIPTLRIDDLALRDVDLIHLDVEGYELFALRGARNTIGQHRPIIALEDKRGCCEQFGYRVGDVERFLDGEFGYRTIKRFHGNRDVILEPRVKR